MHVQSIDLAIEFYLTLELTVTNNFCYPYISPLYVSVYLLTGAVRSMAVARNISRIMKT